MFRLFAACVCLCAYTVQCMSIGDRLERDYTIYTKMPYTAADAQSAGWHALGDCLPNLGIPYTQDSSGPTESEPITIFFTPGGQAAGVGVTVFGSMPDNLVSKGFFMPTDTDDQYFIVTTYRSADDVCSSATFEYPLGDQIVVNPMEGGANFHIPLNASDALAFGYQQGSCFSGMGNHFFFDLSLGSGKMSWEGKNLMPIVPMYDLANGGRINAVFFASTVRQQTILPPSYNEWEPVPLLDALMCKNWCNKDCTFHDTSLWSTLHVYFRDRSLATCPGGCTIGCC